MGISALVRVLPDDPNTAPDECGSATIPPRGHYDESTGKCKCNALSTSQGGIFGDVKDFFTGDACQCETITVNGERLVCAGRGKCVSPSIPYGTCSAELDAIRADPLFQPFVSSTSDVSVSRYVLRRGSLLTISRTTYLLENDLQVDFVDNVLGANFSTCDSKNDFVADAVFNSAASVSELDVNVTLMRLENDCDACACDGNGDLLTDFTPTCIATRLHASNDLGNVSRCRAEWVEAGEISKDFFNNTANGRDFDSVRTCVADYTFARSATQRFVTLAPGLTERIRFTCARGDRDPDASVLNPYGTLRCNNFVHRVIDESLSQILGGDYARQCAFASIKDYSHELGEFFGAFRTAIAGLSFLVPRKQWTDAHYDLVAQTVDYTEHFVVDPDGIERRVDYQSQFLIDSWRNSWFVPIVSNRTFVSYKSLNKYRPQNDSIADLLGAILNVLEPFGVVYEVDEEANAGAYPTRTPPFNGSLLQYAPLLDSYVSGNHRALFDFGRNKSALYFDPGFATVVANTERTTFETIGMNVTSTVDTIRITFPFDLEEFALYTRTGVLCARIVAPRAGDVVDMRCPDGRDPFEFNQQYADYVAFTLADAQNKTDEATANDPSNFTLQTGILGEALYRLAGEGPAFKIVPRSFYSRVPTLEALWSASDKTIAGHTFGPDQSIDLGELYTNDWEAQILAGNLSATLISPAYWIDLGTSAADFPTVWRTLESRIVLDRRFPPNEVYRNMTRTLPNDVVSRPMNLSDPGTRDWLFRLWATHLAPKRCSDSEQCSDNQLGSQCVLDYYDLKLWRFAAKENPGHHVAGDEGGCECPFDFENGFTTNPCNVCVSGYGPDPDPLFPDHPSCVRPYAFGLECGADGTTATVETTWATASVPVFPDDYGRLLTPKCLALTKDGETFALQVDRLVDTDVQFWVSDADPARIVTAIQNALFLNGVSIDAGEVECVNDYAISDTHAIKIHNGTSVVASTTLSFVATVEMDTI